MKGVKTTLIDISKTPGRAIAAWNRQTRYQKAAHMTRGLYALLLIICGVILRYAPTHTGVLGVMSEYLTLLTPREFAGTMILCGIALALIRRPTLPQFFLLTLPLLIYIGYTAQGWILGRYPATSAFLYLVLYLLLMITYWGFGDDGI